MPPPAAAAPKCPHPSVPSLVLIVVVAPPFSSAAVTRQGCRTPLPPTAAADSPNSLRCHQLPPLLLSVATHMLPVPKSLVALALMSSLVKATAFYCSCCRRAPSHIILSNGSTSAVSNNTASVNEYELLKKSRPFRIHARLSPTYGKRDGNKGSSEAKKIVHFQRQAQGTLFGRFTFCFQFGSFLTSNSQRRALGGKERTMQYTKSGWTKPASR